MKKTTVAEEGNDITEMPISWEKQPSGMYIVSIYQADKQYSGKIIKL